MAGGGPLWVMSSLSAVLGSMRKQAEQAVISKPVSSTLCDLCIGSCLQAPALLEFLPSLPYNELLCGAVNEINLFLPKLLSVMVSLQSSGNPNQDSRVEICLKMNSLL